ALTGDKAALAAAVRESLAHAHSASQLHQLADFAARAGDTDLERRILERLTAAGGGGPDTRRRLGILAYQRRDVGEAEKDLSAYVSETGGDYESQMILGDIATKRRDLADARRHYAESLRLLQAAGDSSFRARTVAATLYHRLGQDAEADRLYQALLTSRPNDRNLRADYVSMLMEQGEFARAREVLGKL
ncbi:MAG: tetratricopeptide repeat protein, partial [Acetobacteraceae bacterium]|nr:tetratricopeptide repeat protein [Acetobacteraceae bacterium]